jgi:monofunctional biosynthetic peptidoglycan transglycosylase
MRQYSTSAKKDVDLISAYTRWRRHSSGRVRFLLSRVLATLLFSFLFGHLALGLLSLEGALFLRWINPPVTSLMLFRRIVDNHDIKPVRFIPLEQIPERVQRMFILLEDSQFYNHRGINLEALKRAWNINAQSGYIRFGGSTITQQLVRSLCLVPYRGYLRKYLEVIMALAFDIMMSKERQLELYLNYIEWGEGIFGIGAASEHYFGKEVSRLSLDQQIRLAVIITDPLDYGVSDISSNWGMAMRYDRLWSLARNVLE